MRSHQSTNGFAFWLAKIKERGKEYLHQYFRVSRRNIISTIGGMHGPVRRRISTVYAKSFLQASPHFRVMMSTVLETRLIPILAHHHDSGKAIDTLELSLAYGIDIITATIFGLRYSTNVLQDLEYRDWFFAKFKDYSASGNSFWLNDVPALTSRLQSIGLNPVKPGYYRAKGELEEWCMTLVRAVENLLLAFNNDASSSKNKNDDDNITPGDRPIVFEKLWRAVEEEAKTNQGKSPANPVSLSAADDRRIEVASECLDHIIATREDFGVAFKIFEQSPSPPPWTSFSLLCFPN